MLAEDNVMFFSWADPEWGTGSLDPPGKSHKWLLFLRNTGMEQLGFRDPS